MRDIDILRIQQLEELLKPLRKVADIQPPVGGWIRAIREAIGMTNVQLAKRLGRRAPQSIEDLQQSEAAGTIKLDRLRELAEAMGCRLVYAVVPGKPLDELRRERAVEVARRILRRTSHSMKLEAQDVGSKEEERALGRQVEKLLAGNPKRLWE
ncbi:MAG: mobile mystery protein A [Steroidobacteraceae bacterium]